jgi:hypothetical protein
MGLPPDLQIIVLVFSPGRKMLNVGNIREEDCSRQRFGEATLICGALSICAGPKPRNLVVRNKGTQSERPPTELRPF